MSPVRSAVSLPFVHRRTGLGDERRAIVGDDVVMTLPTRRGTRLVMT